MCAKRRSASCKKRQEFWRETHTPLWLLIGRIIFLTREKTSFAILIGRIIFFMCEKHSTLLWLARTHLGIKIYNTAFWWVFLSMYIIKQYYLVGLAIVHAIIEKNIYINLGDVHGIQDSALQWRSCNSSRRTTQCEYIWSLIQICFVDQLMSGPTLLGYKKKIVLNSICSHIE